ncbi:biotin--[acetyl-CoA-carboxylase] ligase [Enemella dayhoffiae]|uniref:biotin--[biotin carboxyl-carrier protein] ligase n=1 Tax=Enemella dayhoffiae TaxID=2016507 RepID=A0A255H0V1_9ACTN|nr:biotin--[acetyl-CoA-carboxylase] ligase [Enemella dayhoffiae]OYO20803.1 biotin--[acetyl-CoA-carboxylase] ligase [Enemella dayhoffiae]
MPANQPPDPNRLRDLLATSDWWSIEVLPEVGSTNRELALRAAAGAVHGSVLITDNQTAGRGRLDRSWTTPPGVAVACSVLVRPPATIPLGHWLWLSPVLGLAVSRGVRRFSGLAVQLKWPNDVLVAERKLSGLLAERVDTGGHAAAILGFGINVTASAEELPVPTATSLLIEGAPTDATELLAHVLAELAALWRLWQHDLAAVRAAYRAECDTVGRRVRVLLGPDRELVGTAIGVDDSGSLLVETGSNVQAFPAGDVTHLRTAD